MKLDLVKLGRRAEREMTFNIRGQECKFALRPLDGAEYSACLRFAREYAIKEGVADPKPDNPLYELGLALKTIELGCIDTDSPADARASFFGGGPKEIYAALGREEIAFLLEAVELWQSEVSPTIAKMGANELFGAMIRLVEVSEEGRDFFLSLSPAIRLSILRTTCSLALKSLEGKSPISSLSAALLNESASESLPAEPTKQ